MMLSSAFARESESVYVDLLTYNDLEMMKSRKVGNTSTNASLQSQSSTVSKSQMKRYPQDNDIRELHVYLFLAKSTHISTICVRYVLNRYVILTYNSEFDRVHFPLPLAYEEAPTVESLRRTIFRLKRRERERSEHDKGQLVSVKERWDVYDV